MDENNEKELEAAGMNLPAFRIWLCGTFRVERRSGTSYEAIRTAEWGGSSYPRLLLKALLCRPGRQARREALMELLWPEYEPEQAVQHLNIATTKLRSVLRLAKEQESLLLTENDSTMYRLEGQEQLWVDADAALGLLRQAEQLERTSAKALALLEEADHYFRQGPFQQDEEGQWVAGRRATVEQARSRCRLWLAEAYERQNMPGQATTILSLILEEDPFDEDVLCRLMVLLHQQGMTRQAMRYYQSLCDALASEGLEPAEATRTLAMRIQANRSIPSEIPSQLATNMTGSLNMDSLRRNLLQTLVGTGIVASYHYFYHDLIPADYSSHPSIASIHALENITLQFRAMQRRGDTFITQSLYAHIATIQNALEMTHDDTLRRELWRVLAQAQLVARLLPIKKGNAAKAKTFNESAIASAQNSGDTVLVAASIGHLGHLYLREKRDISTAQRLLASAKECAFGCQALQGWCTLVTASIAAHEGNHQKCEALIAEALESVSQIPQSAQGLDLYFTDFNMASVNAFAGNCWLTLDQPKQAYQFLTPSNIEALSTNRQASAYYDLTRAHATRGELEEAQQAAFRSIDLALATENGYIIPRFFSLVKSIQQIYPNTPYITAIAEYAQQALLAKERIDVS